MTYKSYIPSPPLSAYIDDLYYMDGLAPYDCQKVLPAPSSNVMINLGDPFQVYGPGQTEPVVICAESWWVGIWRTYHIVDWPPTVQLFGIHFKPGGAYPFLQLPLSELNSQIVPLELVWGRCAAEIRERLCAAPTIQAGFNLLEQSLLDRLREPPHGLEMVQYAISEIVRRQDALSIQGLSDTIGISQNHLSNQFKRLVGIPPKELTRFYRFVHVLEAISAAEAVDWTTIAHQSGFYDQSHFNRDFAAFTGHNPTDYLRLRRRVTAEHPLYARVCNNLPID